MTTNNPYVLESPIALVEGESYPLLLTIPGSPTITGTPTVKMYNQETDTSSTNLNGSASSPSAGLVLTPTIQSIKGGENYTMAITVVVDGRTEVHKCEIQGQYPY